MKIGIVIEHEGDMFTYTFENDDTGFRMLIDNKQMNITPGEIHELGLMLKRVGSFCKTRATSEKIFEGFDTQWFTGFRRPSSED